MYYDDTVIWESCLRLIWACFGIISDTWRGYSRPITRVDGTFLKFVVKGVFLTAIGHEANNQILSYYLGSGEIWDYRQLYMVHPTNQERFSSSRWQWFVLLSDKSKGLKLLWRQSYWMLSIYRKCVKHIVENLKKNHAKKNLLKQMIWDIARSCM